MRGKTGIAVAVGAVLIVAGIAYIGSGDKQPSSGSTASNAPSPGSTAEQSTPTVALSSDLSSPGSGSRSTPEANSNTSASPAPRRVEESTTPVSGTSLRPEPAETHAPAPSFGTTGLPAERPGLSTVIANVGTEKMDAPVAKAETAPPSASPSPIGDVPPNADKEAAPVLPPITPVEMARTESTATRPAGTSSVTAKPAEPPTKATPAPAGVAEAKPADKPAEKGKPRQHVIKAGDTYTSLAVQYFGSAKYAKDIEKANPGKTAKKLFVGAKITIPEPPAGATAKAPEAASTAKPAADTAVAGKPKANTTTAKPPVTAGTRDKSGFAVPPPDPKRAYTVQPGEGWFDLASKFLGKGENYPQLYEYNKERVGGDPHLLRAGTVIELPPGAKLPSEVPAKPAAQPTTPPTRP